LAVTDAHPRPRERTNKKDRTSFHFALA